MANEKRLIGYDPVAFGEFVQSLKNTLEVYDPYSDGYEDGVDRIGDWLECNYVDAVEVVRCKDCKWYTERKNKAYDGHFCERIVEFVQPDDFCSYGERKEV